MAFAPLAAVGVFEPNSAMGQSTVIHSPSEQPASPWSKPFTSSDPNTPSLPKQVQSLPERRVPSSTRSIPRIPTSTVSFSRGVQGIVQPAPYVPLEPSTAALPLASSAYSTLPSRHTATQQDSIGTPPGDDRVPEGNVRLFSSNPLADRISREVLEPALGGTVSDVQSLEPPPGWNSIQVELTRLAESSEKLLRRKAFESAREDAIRGLRLLARTIDLHLQRWECEPALHQALVAIEESKAFETNAGAASGSLDRIVSHHSTPVLQGHDLLTLSPAIAAQHYRAYARDAFLVASNNHPWSADMLCVLGKTYECEAEQDMQRRLMHLQHATLCYQVAFEIAPARPTIACQLGTSLLALDRADEAALALQSSLGTVPTPQAWNAMAEVHRRLGQVDQARSASEQARLLSERDPTFTAEKPAVTEVTPEEFARFSPPPMRVNPSVDGSLPITQSNRSAESGPRESPPSAANANRGWFPRILR